MRTIKTIIERPTLIWFLIGIGLCVFFTVSVRHTPITETENIFYDNIKTFSESGFPPKISTIRNVQDWHGRLGYYAVMGKVFGWIKGDLQRLRIIHLSIALLALFLFIRLAFQAITVYRLNPLWISIALGIFVINPNFSGLAFYLNDLGLLLFFLFSALTLFYKDRLGWASLFLSFATLINWIALLLAIAFVITRIIQSQSRFLKPERVLSLLLPFVVGMLPFVAWNGLVPQSEAATVWQSLRLNRKFFEIQNLFYMIALLPIYGFYFTWTWGFKARIRNQILGLIITAVATPIYFLFPTDLSGSAGFIDLGTLTIAGSFRHLLLFIPWAAGLFLLCQLALMQMRDHSRPVYLFILLFFSIQPFVLDISDFNFFFIVPFTLLITLSEALVSEAGKLI